MDRKKELKEQYKQMKSDMGLIAIINNETDEHYLIPSQDTKAMMNRIRFQLDLGGFKDKHVQRQWKELGEGSFTIKVLEKLEYDKDESKTDYKEDLEVLKMMWEEKLSR